MQLKVTAASQFSSTDRRTRPNWTCPGIYTSFTIAVDDEGDVFISGETYQPAIQKLLEFPAGATTCKILNRKPKMSAP